MVDLSINRCNTACFTGYRPKKFDFSDKKLLEQISVRLAILIFALIDKGYNTFLFGGAPGFDILAARAVLYAKKVKPDLRLICVLPYKDFHLSKEFDDYWRAQYLKIIGQCSKVIELKDHYQSNCYMDRNICMVDYSSQLICLFNGTKGGTHNTIEYAKKQDLTINNVLD